MKVRAILSKDSGGISVADFVIQKSVQWVTTAPRAPHFGGLWEATVRSMKRHLRRSVGTQILSFEELNTYLIQIEAILNSRPITSMSNDPNDLRPLTPAHFLLGVEPESNHSVDDDNLHIKTRHRLLEKMKFSFWKSWHCDHLVSLQIRKKWLSNGPIFAVGDLVLIAEDNQRPSQWKLGRITELYSGNESINRVAKVITDAGMLVRPVVKLRKLPVDFLLPQITRSSIRKKNIFSKKIIFFGTRKL